jgi:two-component system, NtrC family, sensor histidine kinase GlrK
MKLLRPRSLSALVLLGLAIFVLPLVAALIAALLQMTQLTTASGRIVTDSVATTRRTQELVAETLLLERRAQIYSAVRGDPLLLEPYETALRRVSDIERTLDAMLPGEDAREALRQFSAQRANVGVQALAAVKSDDDFERTLRGNFTQLRQILDVVAARNEARVDAETAALRTSTQRVVQLMTWGSILLLPLSATAILLFSLLVGRPLRQIDRAISELGSGALHRPIAIRGPPAGMAATAPAGTGAGAQPLPQAHVP